MGNTRTRSEDERARKSKVEDEESTRPNGIELVGNVIDKLCASVGDDLREVLGLLDDELECLEDGNLLLMHRGREHETQQVTDSPLARLSLHRGRDKERHQRLVAHKVLLPLHGDRVG